MFVESERKKIENIAKIQRIILASHHAEDENETLKDSEASLAKLGKNLHRI